MTARNEIIFELWKSTERFAVTLLAAAGAVVAFIIGNLAAELSKVNSTAVLAAVFFTACSFGFGILVRWKQVNLLKSNIKVLHLLSEYAHDGLEYKMGVEVADVKLSKQMSSISFCMILQILFLTLGAGSYMYGSFYDHQSFAWVLRKE